MTQKYYSDIHYHLINNSFQHNLENDFGFIALWKSARPHRDKIRELLSSQFEILMECEIHWSVKNFEANANRLYEAPIYSSNSSQKSSHSNKIGDNQFIIFIIRDFKPNYTYAQSVSGKIELSNINIVNSKYQIRDWIQKESGIKYGIHSTNNIHEFFFQVPLLLGKDRFYKLLKGDKISEDKIVKDLEGAEGWRNYAEMFDVLNLTTNYLVLRGFETLPTENPEMDVDFLTDNHQRLASALGAIQNQNKTYKGKVLVNQEEISLDMRFIGDKYYPIDWAREMIRSKILKSGIFSPRNDQYFFSLLYHAKAQKPAVKEKYIFILEKLAEQLNFDWYKTDYLHNDEIIGKILNGFYQSQNYYFENPIDEGVFKNNNVIKHLSQIPLSPRVSQSIKIQLKSNLKKHLPDSLIQILKNMKK